jgi:hypothetical protein
MPASDVTVARAGPEIASCRRVSATTVASWKTPNAAASGMTASGWLVSLVDVAD